MVTHGYAAGSGITFLFGNAETEVVGVAHIGGNAHLEDSDALLATIDFMVIVGVLDFFQSFFSLN